EGEKSTRDLRISQAFLYRKAKFVSCWHASNVESAAMWKIYGENENGIAVISDIARMKSAFHESVETIYAGRVSYIDFAEDRLDLGNGFTPLVHKRSSFEHEKEVRLVWTD